MARRRRSSNSVFELVRSRAFLGTAVVASAVVAGAMAKRWHANRTELLRREVSQLEARVAALRDQERDCRVRLAQRLDPVFLEEQIRRFGLELGPPREEQIVTIEEPEWLVRLAQGGKSAAGHGVEPNPLRAPAAGQTGWTNGPVLGASRRMEP